jgi:hypothetical protein
MKKYKITFLNPDHDSVIVTGTHSYSEPTPMLDALSGVRYWAIDANRFPIEQVLCITEVKE